MRVLLACVLLFCVMPNGVGGEPLPGPIPAEVLRVVDGDTIEVRADVWPGHRVRVMVRLAGIDAPELRSRCPREKQAARAAKQRLQAMVKDRKWHLRDVRLGKFAGRVIARLVSAQGIDAAAVLRRAELVRAYDGGSRRSWC